MSTPPDRRITPAQRVVLSILLFITVLTIGSFIMLITGKMALPI